MLPERGSVAARDAESLRWCLRRRRHGPHPLGRTYSVSAWWDAPLLAGCQDRCCCCCGPAGRHRSDWALAVAKTFRRRAGTSVTGSQTTSRGCCHPTPQGQRWISRSNVDTPPQFERRSHKGGSSTPQNTQRMCPSNACRHPHCPLLCSCGPPPREHALRPEERGGGAGDPGQAAPGALSPDARPQGNENGMRMVALRVPVLGAGASPCAAPPPRSVRNGRAL